MPHNYFINPYFVLQIDINLLIIRNIIYSIIMKTFNCVTGFFDTPSIVYEHNGWYAIHDGRYVMLSDQNTVWQDGIDTRTIENVDIFEWNEPITSIEQLIEALEA